MNRVSDPWSARQQGHLAYVAEYTSEIHHLPRADNVVADSLSRTPVVAAQPQAVAAQPQAVAAVPVVPPASTRPPSWKEVAVDQATCPKIKAVLLSSSLQLQQVTIQSAEVWCDLSTGSIRPLTPSSCRKAVFEHVHSLSHAGTRATKGWSAAASSGHVWLQTSRSGVESALLATERR